MATKKNIKDEIDGLSLYSHEKSRLKTLVDSLEKENESAHATIRSLGWRWAVVAIVFLTITVFCGAWVEVTAIQSHKDIRIQEIQRGK